MYFQFCFCRRYVRISTFVCDSSERSLSFIYIDRRRISALVCDSSESSQSFIYIDRSLLFSLNLLHLIISWEFCFFLWARSTEMWMYRDTSQSDVCSLMLNCFTWIEDWKLKREWLMTIMNKHSCSHNTVSCSASLEEKYSHTLSALY